MRGVLAHGVEIITARNARGWTQKQLAAAAEWMVKTIRKAEQGQRIDLRTLNRFAEALQLHVSRLIVDEEAADESLLRQSLVVQWHEAWEARDVEGTLAVYTEDAVLTLPGGPTVPYGGEHHGKEAIRRANEMAWNGAKLLPLSIDDCLLLVSEHAVTLSGSKGMVQPSGEIVWFSTIPHLSFPRTLGSETRCAVRHVEACSGNELADVGPLRRIRQAFAPDAIHRASPPVAKAPCC